MLKRVLISLASVCIIYTTVQIISIKNYAKTTQQPVEATEAGVVFGNKVEQDGQPSSRLKARLNHAITLFEQNKIARIIVSGGTGTTGYDEALVMAKYLKAQGIPSNKIIVDQNGISTQATLDFANTFANITNTKSLTMISQDYHMARIKHLTANNPFTNTSHINFSAPYYTDLRTQYSYLREVIALTKEYVTPTSKQQLQNHLHLTYKNKEFTIYKPTNKLEIRYLTPENTPYVSFKNIIQATNPTFVTNGGIYQENTVPLGLLIQNKQELHPLNTVTNAYGNFYLQPNGIFSLKDSIPKIQTTQEYLTDNYQPDFATQSGPLLVYENQINTQFSPTSQNLKTRSGVGITSAANPQTIFAISNTATTFYDFAELFKDILKSPQALYLDGTISQMYIKKYQEKTTNLVPYGPFIVELTKS